MGEMEAETPLEKIGLVSSPVGILGCFFFMGGNSGIPMPGDETWAEMVGFSPGSALIGFAISLLLTVGGGYLLLRNTEGGLFGE